MNSGNSSLSDGVVPLPFKEVLVCLFLRKTSLDPSIVDSLTCFSSEKMVVTQQLQRELEEVAYLVPFQSGFRPRYEMEMEMTFIMLLDTHE